MDTSEKNKCYFRWGECSQGASGSHLCMSDPNHTGLHGCVDCGVVYLRKRPEVINLTFSDQPKAEPFRFQPMRGDEVERWLKVWRDHFPDDEMRQTIDDMLEDYREHADTGTPLDAIIERGKM